MKLVRFGSKGREKAGIVDEQNQVRDVSAVVSDWTGDTLNDETITRISQHAITDFP